LFELFLGFLSVGMYGCGGELPWARCMVVEKRCKMTAGESTDLLVHSSASAALRIRTTSIDWRMAATAVTATVLCLFTRLGASAAISAPVC
jgi:hypothetical protein